MAMRDEARAPSPESENLPVTFRVEQHCEFDKGTIKIGRYFWSRRVEQTIHGIDDALVLNMALTSRPTETKVDRVESHAGPPRKGAGRLLVMMPGAAYHISAPGGSFRCMQCALSCAKLEELAGEPIDWASLSELGGELGPGSKIEHLLMQILDELTCEQLGQAGAIDAYATALCIELLRRFRREQPSRPDVHSGGLATWRMRLVVDRVHADKASPSVTELADLCGLTTRQLSRAFKAETGMTVGRYIDEATMERAHRLLTSTELSVGDIARALGFASADSFAQSYRRITGVLPSRARRR